MSLVVSWTVRGRRGDCGLYCPELRVSASARCTAMPFRGGVDKPKPTVPFNKKRDALVLRAIAAFPWAEHRLKNGVKSSSARGSYKGRKRNDFALESAQVELGAGKDHSVVYRTEKLFCHFQR